VLEKGGAWVGSPQQIIEQARTYHRMVGGFEVASLQVNFATLDYDECIGSLELFGSEVPPTLHEMV
jgi:hypothetical protein